MNGRASRFRTARLIALLGAAALGSGVLGSQAAHGQTQMPASPGGQAAAGGVQRAQRPDTSQQTTLLRAQLQQTQVMMRRPKPAGPVLSAAQDGCTAAPAPPPGDAGQRAIPVPAPAGTDLGQPATQQPQAVPIGMTAEGLAGKARANAGQAEPTTRAPAVPVSQPPRVAPPTPTDDSNAGQEGGTAGSSPGC